MLAATFEYLARFVRDNSANVIDDSNRYLIESRLERLLYSEGAKDVDDLSNKLRTQDFGDLHRKVLEAMTNHETWFLRDISHFDALKQVVLPDLLERRKSQRRLSIWSAGCSSGQEIYSIAMVIREHFRDMLTWNLTLLGSDLSQTILQRAERGRYSQLETSRGLPAALLAKYFEPAGPEWQLSPCVRDMVTFRQMNLSAPWPEIGEFDVVFLRNVLMYFPLDTRKDILQKVRLRLRSRGILFLGAAESTLGFESGYEPVRFQRCLYYKLRDSK